MRLASTPRNWTSTLMSSQSPSFAATLWHNSRLEKSYQSPHNFILVVATLAQSRCQHESGYLRGQWSRITTPSLWAPALRALSMFLNRIAPVFDFRDRQPVALRAGLIPCGGPVQASAYCQPDLFSSAWDLKVACRPRLRGDKTNTSTGPGEKCEPVFLCFARWH
jgi:hypothetical protein